MPNANSIQKNTHRLLSRALFLERVRQGYSLPSYFSISNHIRDYAEKLRLEKFYFDLFNDTLSRTNIKSMELSVINRVDLELFPIDFDAMWYNLEGCLLLDTYVTPSVYGTFIEDVGEFSEYDPWFVLTNRFQGYPEFFDNAFFERLTLLPTPYDGLAIEYLCLTQDSGNIFIDLTTQCIYEGLRDHFQHFWTQRVIQRLASRWKEAKPMIDKLQAYRRAYRSDMLSELERLIFND